MSRAPDPWWKEGNVNLSEVWQHSSLAAAALALVSVAALTQCQRWKYPRGPSMLSAILGMIFHSENILEYKEAWRRRFGNVYTLFIGRMPAVVMTDYDVIHDAFVRQADACSSRPPVTKETATDIAGKGIMGSPHWKEQRKFAIAVLREQGMGKVDMEHKIREEIAPFLNEIESHCGSPVNVDAYMHRAVSNVICNLVLGSRFDYGNPIFVSLLEQFLKQTSQSRKMRFIGLMPLLRWLPFDIFGFHRFLADARVNADFFLKAIHQHKETLDPSSPRDFIDAYLIEMKTRVLSGRPSSFDEANCVASVMQLFLAGTDTTANTLLWAWLFMILHPEVQKQVQNEVDRCIGSRHPSLYDRASMPFTEAVLTEVLRIGNTTISSLPHLADADINVDGHVVPKGTLLFASLSDVHLDERIYTNPKDFDPQRFLGSSGNFEKPKKFVPFSMGRRACPGESLARAELFLFFTSVLQHFNLSTPEGCVFRAEGKTELAHKPLPYEVVFTRRRGLP